MKRSDKNHWIRPLTTGGDSRSAAPSRFAQATALDSIGSASAGGRVRAQSPTPLFLGRRVHVQERAPSSSPFQQQSLVTAGNPELRLPSLAKQGRRLLRLLEPQFQAVRGRACWLELIPTSMAGQ